MRSSAGEFLKLQAVSPSVPFHLEIAHHSVFFPLSASKSASSWRLSPAWGPPFCISSLRSVITVSVVCRSEEPDFLWLKIYFLRCLL